MQSNKSNGQLTAQINLGDHKKSGFDLSNNVLGTGKIGRIIPTRALHVMPGDTIKADSKVAVQFEPLAVPILANMDVKQEHFYVPYNVVWKNWDKFISGGEKLDYAGIVPNVKMSNIYLKTFNKFFILNELILSCYRSPNIGTDADPQYVVGCAIANLPEKLESLKENLNYLGEQYKIKDLLQPQYRALELIENLDTSTYPESDYGMMFKFVPTLSLTQPAKVAVLKNYLEIEGLQGNKYLEEVTPYLYEFMDARGFLMLPTPYGMDMLQYLYEFVKPFVGIGSNLDYLNMCRLSFSEMIANIISRIVIDIDESEQPSYQASSFFSLGYVSLNEMPLSILNLRANYNIWYNNYRDILLEADAFEPYDGDNITDDELFVLLVPRQRCWEKDAFTTALDNAGTGNVGVPITRDVNNNAVTKVNKISLDDTIAKSAQDNDMEIAEITFNGEKWKVPTAFLSGQNVLENTDQAFGGFSLHALDAAQRAQKWLQKALYFGNRISDFYYMRFGVRFLDARLRLPELLTSSSELVKLDVVMNNTNITTEAGGEVFRSIAGDRAAYASAYDNGNSFDRFCEEHGVIMSYLTIMPQITYAYGINRDYSRLDQFDFAFAEFATLGMDAVYDTEISATSFAVNDSDTYSQVFGYQGRYYDYKAKHSEEHGELLDSQDMYTFARKFNMFDPNGRPRLNYEFVHCFPSLDMFVVDDEFSDYFRYDIRHSTAAERELPAQSIYI